MGYLTSQWKQLKRQFCSFSKSIMIFILLTIKAPRTAVKTHVYYCKDWSRRHTTTCDPHSPSDDEISYSFYATTTTTTYNTTNDNNNKHYIIITLSCVREQVKDRASQTQVHGVVEQQLERVWRGTPEAVVEDKNPLN